ncbi:MAG: rhomboid family intramembrane serine protease [Terrimicrobiaceae bacterium]
MIADRNSGNTSPLTWVGAFPIYTSTLLATVHAATMVLTALAMAAGAEALIQSFQFSSQAVLGHFAVWQFVTYAFVHRPDIMFLLEIYLLVVFGREIERFLGRRAFLAIYVTLLLLPPVVLSAAALAGLPSVYMGSSALHFGVFIAFASLYPGAEVFFSLQARWVALALLVISALQLLAYSMWTSLGVLLLDCAAAFLLIHRLRTGSFFEWPRFSRPALRILPHPKEEIPAEPLASIDGILEKISKSGMGSLTAKERAQLEKARTELIEKDRNH